MQMQANPELFKDRAAFVLNANARAVTDRVVQELAEVVPKGDLFLSRSFDDAAKIAETIVRRGYGRVFTGGGDGTLVSTLNLLDKTCRRAGRPLPQIGLLRLGTGNAVAGLVHAGRPAVDAAHAASGGAAEARPIWMVKTDDGTLTPFAGMGYDGEILNDYLTLKRLVNERWPFLKPIVLTVFGYLIAMIALTVPRYLLGKQAAKVRLVSSKDAFKIISGPEGDTEVRIPAGQVLYEGKAPVLSVGTVPFFGGGFTMFPHALRRPGTMQVRIAAASIPTILANLWPSVWNGTFRHPQVHDFLVEDVHVEGDRSLDYQVGGDAAGQRQSLSFSVSAEPVDMLVLGERLHASRPRALGGKRRLLPA